MSAKVGLTGVAWSTGTELRWEKKTLQCESRNVGAPTVPFTLPQLSLFRTEHKQPQKSLFGTSPTQHQRHICALIFCHPSFLNLLTSTIHQLRHRNLSQGSLSFFAAQPRLTSCVTELCRIVILAAFRLLYLHAFQELPSIQKLYACTH